MPADSWLRRMHQRAASGHPLVIAGVGSGLTARGAASGGADALTVYNTAVYRVRGLPTALAFLPYDNANELAFEAVPEVLASARDVPVILGLGAHDPRTPPDRLLARAQALGVAGVTNEPFLSLYGDNLRAQLEAAELGFDREIELIRVAAERDMLTLGWVSSPEEARRMAEAGAHLVGAMVGVTSGGAAGGAESMPLSEAIDRIGALAEAATQARGDILVLGHGGPLNDSEAVAELLRRTSVHGYVTGSTGERIPVELAVAAAIRRFKGDG